MFDCSQSRWSGWMRKGCQWVLCLGEWDFCHGMDPPLQQLKNRPNRTSCRVLYIEMLKFSSSSFELESTSCPSVVPVDGAAPILLQMCPSWTSPPPELHKHTVTAPQAFNCVLEEKLETNR